MEFKKYATVIILFSVLVIAFVVRAYSLSTNIQFDSDFGRDSLFALRILQGHPTLLGPAASVGGFYLGPLYYYLVAFIYLAFGLRPYVLSVVFILMGVASVGLGAWLQRKYVSLSAAIIFLLLATTSVPLVQASQSATNQPMMPLLTIIFLGVYMLGLRKNLLLFDIVTGVIFGLFFHVHYSAFLIFIPLLPLFLWQAQGNLSRKLLHLLMFLIGIFIMVSPLILFDIRHNFITTQSLLSYARATTTGSTLSEDRPHLNMEEKTRLIGGLLAPRFFLLIIGLLFGAIISLRKKKFYQTPYMQTLLTLALGSGVLVYLYQGYLFPYYLLIPFTIWLLLATTLLAQIRPNFLGIILAIIISWQSFGRLTYGNKFRTIANLVRVTSYIEKDIEKTKPKNFTIFKDSSDQMTGLGYEYRFLLARDGYSPYSEYTYEKADVLYYIREEGFADPLISTHFETTQFGATKAQLIATPKIHKKTIKIYRLTK